MLPAETCLDHRRRKRDTIRSKPIGGDQKVFGKHSSTEAWEHNDSGVGRR